MSHSFIKRADSLQNDMNQSANSFNVALAGLLDERRKLREENGEIVAEEVKRMKVGDIRE